MSMRLRDNLIKSLMMYLGDKGIFNQQHAFLSMIDAEIENCHRIEMEHCEEALDESKGLEEKPTPFSIVTFDGRVLLPGEDNDYTFTNDGVPYFPHERLHDKVVVQVICPLKRTRRVFQYDALFKAQQIMLDK